MNCAFSLPWFLVVVFAIIAILLALMWLCECEERKYYQDKRYREVDDRLFFNARLFEENKLLYEELRDYKNLAWKYRCSSANELGRVLKQLTTDNKEAR